MLKTATVIYMLLISFCLFGQDFSIDDRADNSAILFIAPEFSLEAEADYSKIVLNKTPQTEGFTLRGTPDIPSFSKLLIVPEQTSVTNLTYEIINEEILENVNLLPSRELTALDNHDYSVFEDRAAYQNDGYLPQTITYVSEQGIMRDYNVARIVVNPFRYNPVTKTLSVIREIRIIPEYSFDRSMTRTNKAQPSEVFTQLSSGLCINPLTTDTRSTDRPGSYLIIYHGTNVSESFLQNFIDWKKRMGYKVYTEDMSNIGTNNTQLKQYIQNAYDTWDLPPEFILLVGDTSGQNSVPIFYENFSGNEVYGDFPYTLLDGEDNFPDALIGRITFNSITELNTIINKMLTYESNPVFQNEWANNTILIGDPNDSGVSTVTTMEYVGMINQNYNENVNFTRVYSNPFISQTNAAMNIGAGALFYRGFGGASGWSESDVDALQNNGKYPFASVITCFTGTFAGAQNSLIELLLKAGTLAAPKGVVGIVGSSSATHTCFNNIITAGIGYHFYVDGGYSLAAALDRGRLALQENYPENPNEYADWYTLGKNFLGDPGMKMYTKQPLNLEVDYPAEIAAGATLVTVNVSDNADNPVENCWVTLLAGNIQYSAYTDQSGNAYVNVNLTETGNVLVTVTKHNCVPHLGSLNVINQNNLTLHSVNITEPVNAGQITDFTLTLHNTSNSYTYSGVQGVISSTSPYVSLIDSLGSFGAISPNSNVTSDSYSIEIAGNCPDNEILNMFVTASGITNMFTLTAHGPEIEINSIVYNAGNSLNPGETKTFYLNITNSGSVMMSNPTATISAQGNLTFTDSTAVFPNILVNGQVNNQTDTFTVTASEDIVDGTVVPVSLIFSSTEGVQREIAWEITVGTSSQNDPTGPDAFGYCCYHSNDTDYSDCPEYQWIEIDPQYGGSGTSLNLSDTDTDGSGDYATIDLPFIFKFYGNTYNTIMVSSNGYIVPGDIEYAEWMNWSIPGPFVPCPIIAPFWDDLLTEDGDVIYYFDQDMHAFIIEWSRLVNRYNTNMEETFQAILYDPLYNGTPTGESKIKFQYLEINNVDAGNYFDYEIDHGEYATVGIASHDYITGLEYTFANNYPVTAQTLTDHSALLFTNSLLNIDGPYLTIVGLNIDDELGNENGIIDNGENVQLGFNFRNIGNELATNCSVEVSENDPYVTMINNISSINDIIPTEIAVNNQAIVLSVDPSCPNNHLLNLNLLIQYSGISEQKVITLRVSAPQAIYSHYTFQDDNNNRLEAGETGAFRMYFTKGSYLPINNITLNFSADSDMIQITNPQVILQNVSEDTFYAEFEVSCSENIPLGEEHTFTLNGVYDNNLTVETQFDYLIAYYLIIFNEDFTQNNTAEWTQFNGQISQTNEAGGTAPEVHLQSVAYDIRQICTQQIDTDNIIKICASFKHMPSSGDFSYYLVAGSIYDQYEIIFSGNSVLSEPEQIYVEYTPSQFLGNSFPIAWAVYSNTYQGGYWAIDDIELALLTATPPEETNVQVNLIGGTGDVTQCTISDGVNSYHPDENGQLTIMLLPGDYTFSASLVSYSTTEIDFEVTEGGQNDITINLDYLTPPENLTCEYNPDTRIVHLTWELEGLNPLRNSARASSSSETTEKVRSSKNIVPENPEIDFSVLNRNVPMTDNVVTRIALDTPVQKSNKSNYFAEDTDFDIFLNEPIDNSDERTPTFSFFRVAIRYNNSTPYMITTTNTEYSRTLYSNGHYDFYIVAVYNGNQLSMQSNMVSLDLVDAEENFVPEKFSLEQNYPNPFNAATNSRSAATTFSFSLPRDCQECQLSVYNIKGELVRTLLNEPQKAGIHTIPWNADDNNGKAITSGIYLYKLKTDYNESIRRMIFIK